MAKHRPRGAPQETLVKIVIFGVGGGAGAHFWVKVGYFSSEKFTDPRLEMNFIVKFEVEVGTFFTVYIFIVHIGNFGDKNRLLLGK